MIMGFNDPITSDRVYEECACGMFVQVYERFCNSITYRKESS